MRMKTSLPLAVLVAALLVATAPYASAPVDDGNVQHVTVQSLPVERSVAPPEMEQLFGPVDALTTFDPVSTLIQVAEEDVRVGGSGDTAIAPKCMPPTVPCKTGCCRSV